jgi:hypothetical protein
MPKGVYKRRKYNRTWDCILLTELSEASGKSVGVLKFTTKQLCDQLDINLSDLHKRQA